MGDALSPTAAAAEAAWAARVRANREQVDRRREESDGTDFYAPIASAFRADPRRSGDATLDALRSLVRPDEVVLDIGAGGGRFALSLALGCREVIALDPSAGMLDVLRASAAEHGVANVRVLEARWPVADPPAADLALIAQVGYDVEPIGAFLDGMEAAARRLCVAVLLDRPPPSAVDALWPEVHGEERASLPALPEFLVLLLARGRLPEVRLVERAALGAATREELVNRARRLLWLRPGGEKDRRLLAQLECVTARDGQWLLPDGPTMVGVVTWTAGPD